MPLRTILLVLSAYAVMAPAASAATKLETFTETVRQTVPFTGAGCATESPQSLPLPAGARNARDLAPPVGTPVAAATDPAPVATITRTAVEGGQATWFATGTGRACEPGMETTPWQTEAIELRVTFDVERRVLTYATVVARANRICRRSARGLDRINERIRRVRAGDLEALARVIRQMAGATRTIDRRLGRLAIPHARAASFRAYRRALARTVRSLDRAADAAGNGRPRATVSHMFRALRAIQSAVRHARRYGLRDCAT